METHAAEIDAIGPALGLHVLREIREPRRHVGVREPTGVPEYDLALEGDGHDLEQRDRLVRERDRTEFPPFPYHLHLPTAQIDRTPLQPHELILPTARQQGGA